jgi:hypothetical protein
VINEILILSIPGNLKALWTTSFQKFLAGNRVLFASENAEGKTHYQLWSKCDENVKCPSNLSERAGSVT